MSSVVVTGANGFLGSWLTKTLLEQGHQVKALVRKSSDLSELNGVACDYVYGDVTDSQSLGEAFKGADAVFHLAGLIAYRKADRPAMERVNVQGTANVVKAIADLKIPRLIHLSSVVAVGAGFSDQDVLNEDSKYNVSHLDLGYFETKKAAEQIVKEATTSKKIDSVILNPATIYGPGDARKGSRKTQLKVAQGKFPFYTKGGVNVVAVEDVVAGIISGWKKGRSGERYILSSENIRIRDLFKEIANVAGTKAPSILFPSPLLHLVGAGGDMAQKFGFKGSLSRENAWTATLYHWFSSEKAQRELDFKPRPARFAVERSVIWMKEQGLLNQ